MTTDERVNYIKKMFHENPELFKNNSLSLILQGIIETGMTPFEAKLAGGAFAYKVIADPSRWPEHSDPLKVMWTQSLLPDNTKIWMTFKNTTQFSSKSDCIFQVYFVYGRAAKIEKMKI